MLAQVAGQPAQEVLDPGPAYDDSVGEQAALAGRADQLGREDAGADERAVAAHLEAAAADPAVAGDVVDRYVGGPVTADGFQRFESTFGVPGPRVVPVDDAEGGVARQARVVAVLVEVVEVEQREPGLLREVRLAGPRGAGEQHEPGLRSHPPEATWQVCCQEGRAT